MRYSGLFVVPCCLLNKFSAWKTVIYWLSVELHYFFRFQGDIIYANYGEEKDFKLLAAKGVPCLDKIVIMRYGRIFPGQMVMPSYILRLIFK
jgi:hypothetical protein